MSKLLLPLLAILLLMACQKEITTTKAQEEIASATAHKQVKISVCHNSKTIEVSQNALAAHLAHGDVQGECSTIQTATICDQVWMVKNLDVTTYRNGDVIPQVVDPTAWAALTTGAWCYYENNSANGTTFGKLYNWYAVADPRGLAPVGWHVPTDAEWLTLETCLNEIEPTGNVGGKMKEAGTAHWVSPNTAATNSSGFTGLPGGNRISDGTFSDIGNYGHWWSSTVFNVFAWTRTLFYDVDVVGRGLGAKRRGFSVRCVRD